MAIKEAAAEGRFVAEGIGAIRRRCASTGGQAVSWSLHRHLQPPNPYSTRSARPTRCGWTTVWKKCT